MKGNNHFNKTEFQIERLAFFSDAVFAIAMTLLIIEIKVPEIDPAEISEKAFGSALLALYPKFMGYFFSFFIIGLYWFVHHDMFGYLVNYNGKLIWLNIVFLFSIVLMPFSTAVYSEYSSPAYIMLISPYAFYVANICLSGILNYWMWGFIGNPKNGLAGEFPTKNYVRKARVRALIMPGVFLLSLLVAVLIHPAIARFVLFLIPVFMSLTKKVKESAPARQQVRNSA